ncbi:SPARC-related modular calcium-binding protein 1-like isoform X2 [Physella acuta]|uniref:SPARC-related modular calcium-binding protein 1-like isoform X2 n=1 Tax=Physella acuta TaxID=109671 RepID=UPI0027DAF6C0|nr:SPARC-related modular calcium-binding protein 1-like isoform X2 [Physella acuta]
MARITSLWWPAIGRRYHVTISYVVIIVCFMQIFQPSLTVAVDLSQVDKKGLFHSLMASRCNMSCAGSAAQAVCGTDGVTYPSRCDLKRAKKCDRKNVKVKHPGKCAGDSAPVGKCTLERLEALQVTQTAQNSDVLIPTCKEDGSFHHIQCHNSSGYCWCVTKEGRHIPGTSSKGPRPTCSKASKRNKRKGGRVGKSRKTKEECGPKERQLFNTGLIKVFKEEYDRVNPSPPPSKGGLQAPGFGTEKAVVLWKFDELDVNKDGKLKFKEIRKFKKMVKKLMKPKLCAKDFLNFCDKKTARTIDRSDWTLCLGVDLKLSFHMFLSMNSASHVTSTSKPSHVPREDTIKVPLPPSFVATHMATLNSGPSSNSLANRHEKKETSQNCLEERESAMNDNSQEPNAKYYIPSCTPSGHWEKAQCHHNGYCWCVSESTGEPIPGTATFNVTPSCTFENERELKGCPLEHKRKFLIDLMADLTEERKKSLLEGDNHNNTNPTETLAQRETVARWKLKNLDKNNNGILERKEWRPFRKTTLKNKSYPRKCRRSFLRYCDEDNNKKITFEEWKDCLGLNQFQFNSLPINPKRSGKNPFMDQLT